MQAITMWYFGTLSGGGVPAITLWNLIRGIWSRRPPRPLGNLVWGRAPLWLYTIVVSNYLKATTIGFGRSESIIGDYRKLQSLEMSRTI